MSAEHGIPDSLDLHLNDEGELVFSRALLHAAIIKELLEPHGPGESARADFTAGGPASGKSGLIDHLGLADGVLLIDVDAIRERLPEYADWQRERPDDAAVLTQREAATIAQHVFAAALQDRQAVVFDGVGGNDAGKFTERIAATLTQTHAVRVFYATVDVDTALEREEARYQAIGRRVPRAYLVAKHAEVSRGLADVARLNVERIEIYDSSGEIPQLLAAGPGGAGTDGLHVVHPEGYAAFVRKGDE
jgi:predicted ABC-type ATPase